MPLFMVIERFGEAGLERVGARFQTHGRMLPDGVEYIDSWMELGGARCYQVMRAQSAAALDEWIVRWSDLVRFEVHEVAPSAVFWSARSGSSASSTRPTGGGEER